MGAEEYVDGVASLFVMRDTRQGGEEGETMTTRTDRLVENLVQASYDTGYLSGMKLDGSQEHEQAKQERAKAWLKVKEEFAFLRAINHTPPEVAALVEAARAFANSVSDAALEEAREAWGNTNVAVVQHWREATRAALAPFAEKEE